MYEHVTINICPTHYSNALLLVIKFHWFLWITVAPKVVRFVGSGSYTHVASYGWFSATLLLAELFLRLRLLSIPRMDVCTILLVEEPAYDQASDQQQARLTYSSL